MSTKDYETTIPCVTPKAIKLYNLQQLLNNKPLVPTETENSAEGSWGCFFFPPERNQTAASESQSTALSGDPF